MTNNRPRTQEDFNKWYNESGGDPWNYKSSNITSRLKDSLSFILTYIPKDYKGNILELGIFQGDFTYLLCKNFKKAKIYANDISDVALETAKEKLKGFENVSFFQADLININKNDIQNNDDRLIILLLECLYYLKEQEREITMKNLRDNFPKADIFLSAPIIGGHYFTEEGLMDMMKRNGYALSDHKVLNLRKFSYLKSLLNPLTNLFAALRMKLANQVIYYFKPI